MDISYDNGYMIVECEDSTVLDAMAPAVATMDAVTAQATLEMAGCKVVSIF